MSHFSTCGTLMVVFVTEDYVLNTTLTTLTHGAKVIWQPDITLTKYYILGCSFILSTSWPCLLAGQCETSHCMCHQELFTSKKHWHLALAGMFNRLQSDWTCLDYLGWQLHQTHLQPPETDSSIPLEVDQNHMVSAM